MMRNIERVGVLLIAAFLLAGVLFGCARTVPEPAPEAPVEQAPPSLPPEPPPAPAPVLAVNSFQRDYTTSDGALLLEVSYQLPQIENAEGYAPLEEIDAFYDAEMARLTGEELDELIEMARDAEGEGQIAGFPFHAYYTGMGYEEKYNGERYLSVLRTHRTYFGGAHDHAYYIGDAFDCRTGARLEAQDLFTIPAEEARSLVMELIRAQMEEKMGESDPYFPGAAERLLDETFQVEQFYLTEDGVVWFFHPYDIAPYAGGIPEFLIPYDELKDVLALWN